MHWNRSLFEERFVKTFRQALDAYISIANRTGVQIHSYAGIEKYLQAVVGDFEEFKNISLKGSQRASKREALTAHELEYLVNGRKATFCIENYLGGIYYLTPDEIVLAQGRYIIQESKNSTKSLPSLSDIQDGLFKLILYANIDSLKLNEQQVSFLARLMLTGKNIRDSVVLPCSLETLEKFLKVNSRNASARLSPGIEFRDGERSTIFSSKEQNIIKKLLLEVQQNSNLEIEIRANN